MTSLVARSRTLIDTARFMTLATASSDGAWASTVNYVPLDGPLRLVWYSMRQARHSRNLRGDARVSGSIFRTDLGAASPIGLDGVQFAGTAREIPDGEAARYRDDYYRLNFPEAAVRAQWMLPLAQFVGDGPRRFYELTIERWWLLDIDRWLIDKEDRRIAVDVGEL